jgi:hypothetical protein
MKIEPRCLVWLVSFQKMQRKKDEQFIKMANGFTSNSTEQIVCSLDQFTMLVIEEGQRLKKRHAEFVKRYKKQNDGNKGSIL